MPHSDICISRVSRLSILARKDKTKMISQKYFAAMETYHCTEVRFASFLSGGFITAILVNPPKMKQAKRTSVH